MANMREETVRAPKYESKGPQLRALVDVPMSAQSPVQQLVPNVPGDTTAALFDKTARVFSDVARRIGDFADKAAIAEGEAEGRRAGLDPEFRPRGDLTLYSQAYDQAGLDLARRRVAIELDDQMDAVANLHQADPKALTEALDKTRKGFLAGLNDGLANVLGPEVELQFRRKQVSLARAATRAQQAEIKAGQAAALQQDLRTKLRGVEQKAYALGLDPTADGILAAEVVSLKNSLSVIGPDGRPLVGQAQAQKLLNEVETEIAQARTMGAFSRLDTAADRQAFVANLRDEFASGKGLGGVFDFDQFATLERTLEAELRAEETRSSAGARKLLKRIAAVQEVADAGLPPPASELKALKAEIAAGAPPEVAAALDVAETTLRWQTAARRSTPAELDAWLATERDRLEKGGATEIEVERIAAGERLLTKMRTEIKRDVHGWADRVGILPNVPLDFSSDEALAASLTERIAAADELSQRYAVAPQYLRPDEKRALVDAMGQGGPATVDVASRLASSAGARAPNILAELSKQAPTLAVIGGHVAEFGATPFANDAAAGLELAKLGQSKTIRPKRDEVREAAREVLADALAGRGEDEAAIFEAATLAYTARAHRLEKQDFDPDLFANVVRELIGERSFGGEVYGGIAYSNPGFFYGGDGAVIVPPNIKRDGFRELIEAVRLEDLIGQHGGPVHETGTPADLADVRQAQLVQVGDGAFALNLGTADAPRFLRNAQGRHYVLDLNRLEPVLKKRRPDLYLGGS